MRVGQLFRHGRSRSILSDESGAIAVLAALAMVGVVAIAGLAVEYGLAVSQKTKLQKSLDAAVLAGVSSSGSAEALSAVVGGLSKDAKIAIAESVFAANKVDLPAIDGAQFRFEDEILVGSASAHINTSLLQVIGIPRIDIGAQANATSSYVRAPLCFMAMHPTRKHTLELDGAVSVIAPDCHIYGNSNNLDDVVDPHTDQNFLVGKSVQAVGFGHHVLQNVTPPLEHAPELIPDPLAALPIPPAGRCDFTNIVVAGVSRTLTPGFYCGGLKITGGAMVTFAPGLYSISGDKFIVNGSEISGSGVTVSLADRAVQLMWTRSKIRLSAPKLDQYAGIVMMGARVDVNHALDASTIDLHGVVYLPKGAFSWSNTGTPSITAKWTAWIVDGVSWTGDGTININFNLRDSDIPYPPQLNVIPRPGSARIVM